MQSLKRQIKISVAKHQPVCCSLRPGRVDLSQLFTGLGIDLHRFCRLIDECIQVDRQILLANRLEMLEGVFRSHQHIDPGLNSQAVFGIATDRHQEADWLGRTYLKLNLKLLREFQRQKNRGVGFLRGE